MAECGATLEVQIGATLHAMKCTAHADGWHVAPRGSRWKTTRPVETVHLPCSRCGAPRPADAECPACRTTSITCPVCGRTSHHPQDVLHGWCGACKRQTGEDRSRL